MSCWRNVSVESLNSVNHDLVIEALKNLGLGLDLNQKEVKGFYENRTGQVDGCIIKNNTVLSLGIVFADEQDNLKIVGDFWNTGLDEQVFMDDLAQQYVNLSIQEQLNNMNYNIESVETDSEGNIIIDAYCA